MLALNLEMITACYNISCECSSPGSQPLECQWAEFEVPQLKLFLLLQSHFSRLH